MKNVEINKKGGVSIDGEVLAGSNKSGRRNNFQEQSREVITVTGKGGAVDMKLGGIVTKDRELTNRVDFDDQEDDIAETEKLRQKMGDI
jgi:hypothetical protein